MFFFKTRIDNFDITDRATVEFGDQLLAPVVQLSEFVFPKPIVIRIGFDNVRLLVPMPQKF
jgi:hypothetical protein